MELHRNKVIFVIDENENAIEVNDLMFLFHCLKTKNIQTIIVGEFDKEDNVVFEKQFSEVTVLSSSFGKK
jgi:hypothetical protein